MVGSKSRDGRRPGRGAGTWRRAAARRLAFYDDSEEKDAKLSAFLEEELGDSTFDQNLLKKWQFDVESWKHHLTERHHSDVKVAELMSEGKAFVMNFDIRSLGELLPGGKSQALEVYQDLADSAMNKCLGAGSVTSNFVQNV